MKKSTTRSIKFIIGSLLIAFLVAKANEQYSIHSADISVYLISAVIAFAVNWLGFIPAYVFQTEKYYDLIGSFTYLSVILTAAVLCDIANNPRAILVSVLVYIWAIRLGSFLFTRIIKSGGLDSRFDDIKPVSLRFLAAWTLQGLWVFLTLAAALAIITSAKNVSLGLFSIIGLIIWLIGFSIEVISDWQKASFRKNLDNKGQFISSGLWAYSRHPNYFGEITLWTGVFIISIPILQGVQWVVIISPIFVYLLITYLSGINKLEKIADERWGGQNDYETYKAQTSVLVLRPKKSLQ